MTEGSYGRRMTVLAAVIAFTFAALVTRLWFLQVLAAEEYRGRAQTNRVRVVPIAAPRGQILDRHGDPLVTNEQAIVLTVDRSEVNDEDALLRDLSELLEVPTAELRRRLEDLDYLPYQPVPVWERTSQEVAVYISEHAEQFPGVDFQMVGARTYVTRGSGPLAPHLVGSLGEINAQEVLDPSFAGLLPGQLVGRGGVEQYYEHYLRGESGWQKLEVDASGEVLGTIGRQEPIPGNDLVLALDAEIQQLAQDTLGDAIGEARTLFTGPGGTHLKATAGSVVVMDPDTGQILAMTSFPTFDPRKFLNEVTDAELKRLYSPRRNQPLTNRAVAGLYPPGSTFKPFIAAAAVKAGYADLSGATYPCPPTYQVPNDTSGTVFHNWSGYHQGYLSLAESLVRSCDTVYYDFGYDFYQDRDVRGENMQQQLKRWGFGRETGIDSPGEQEGRIPDQRWKELVHEQWPNVFPDDLWFPGDNINMSIGQGDVLVTPLQLATAYSAIANGGKIYRPEVGLKIVDADGKVVKRIKPKVTGRVPASPATLAFLRDALTGVVAGSGGTATLAFDGYPHREFPVAGKTGTSEVTVDGKETSHSLFAAMAPAPDPEYVVVALVEEGGHGSEVAAPIVREILEGIFGVGSEGITIGGQVTD
jgi:penicillin-binding protein 2